VPNKVFSTALKRVDRYDGGTGRLLASYRIVSAVK